MSSHDPSLDALARLAAVIESRKPAHGGDPDKSYVARLLAKGPDAFLKKIGEEATETVMAAKDLDREFTPALQARNPLTGTNIGVGSEGLRGELELTVTSDFVQGRDPAEVYNSCVYRKSGQMPRQPLYARPDWRG